MSKRPYCNVIPIEIRDDKDIKKEWMETKEEQAARLLRERKYEVEDILDHRPRDSSVRCIKYLIQWRGFDKKESTWEDASRIAFEVPYTVNRYWDEQAFTGPDGKKHFEVEYISSHKPASATNEDEATKYLIHYVGFSNPEWKKKRDCHSCRERVMSYWERRKRRMRQLKHIKNEGSSTAASTTDEAPSSSSIDIGPTFCTNSHDVAGPSSSSTSVRIKIEAPEVPPVRRKLSIATKSRHIVQPRRQPRKSKPTKQSRVSDYFNK